MGLQPGAHWQRWMAVLHKLKLDFSLPGLGIKTKHALPVTGNVCFFEGEPVSSIVIYSCLF